METHFSAIVATTTTAATSVAEIENFYLGDSRDSSDGVFC